MKFLLCFRELVYEKKKQKCNNNLEIFKIYDNGTHILWFLLFIVYKILPEFSKFEIYIEKLNVFFIC